MSEFKKNKSNFGNNINDSLGEKRNDSKKKYWKSFIALLRKRNVLTNLEYGFSVDFYTKLRIEIIESNLIVKIKYIFEGRTSLNDDLGGQMNYRWKLYKKFLSRI